MESDLFLRLGVAVGLGLLVGLQRQRADSLLAGIRTFPLIAVLGVLCGVLAGPFGGWVVVAGLLAVAALTVMANVVRLAEGPFDPGITTEVAVLVVFVIGVALTRDLLLEATVAAGGVAVLLHWKAPLHRFAERMGADDFAALMRFVLIALVVLPVLPNRAYGPYQVLNPFQIWLIVVLVVGISMAGYVAFKLFGTRAGALAAGLLGGVISSTATTVSYARRSRQAPGRSRAAALIVALASTVVFGRVILEIAVVAPSVLGATVGPLAAMMGLMFLASAVLYALGIGTEAAEIADEQPPSDLWAAVVFGALYAVILLAVAVAEDRFGQSGLYAVAAISGLTDVDAITLSTAQLMKAELSLDTGWRMILVGALSNLIFKGGLVLALGSPGLRRRVGVSFGVAVLGGIGILFFWP